jgi:threonine/homoserine/homoserine lactone efflux protein
MGFLALVAATKGRRLGFYTVAGIALGLLVVGLLAAIGIATLVDRSDFLYETLRFGGGAYLFWLAWQQWREADGRFLELRPSASKIRKYFRYGLTVNLLNPKAAVFYIAILPTYLSTSDTRAGSTVFEAIGLTLIYVTIATLVHLLIVAFAGSLQPILQKDRLRKATARILALLLAAVAVWMVLKTAR